jgi:hypothetical protein
MDFTLPSSTITDLTASVSDTIGAFWPLAVVALGIPLAFYVARRIIALFPHASGKKA